MHISSDQFFSIFLKKLISLKKKRKNYQKWSEYPYKILKFQCSVLFVNFWKVAKKKYCFKDITFQQDNVLVHRSLIANNFFNEEWEVLKWPEYEMNLYLNEHLR